MNEDETLDLCAALSGGLLMGGMAAFSAYATSVEIEDAKKQVSALEEEKKKVESTLNQLEGLKADTAAYVKKLDGSLSSLAEELEQLGNRITLKRRGDRPGPDTVRGGQTRGGTPV